MLTYDKVPQEIKNTVVRILADEGVNFESLQICAAVLALENLQVLEAEKDNIREYAKLALEIYMRAIAEAIEL